MRRQVRVPPKTLSVKHSHAWRKDSCRLLTGGSCGAGSGVAGGSGASCGSSASNFSGAAYKGLSELLDKGMAPHMGWRSEMP